MEDIPKGLVSPRRSHFGGKVGCFSYRAARWLGIAADGKLLEIGTKDRHHYLLLGFPLSPDHPGHRCCPRQRYHGDPRCRRHGSMHDPNRA